MIRSMAPHRSRKSLYIYIADLSIEALKVSGFFSRFLQFPSIYQVPDTFHHGMAMMRAVRYWGNRDIRVESMPIASCGDGEVRVSFDFVSFVFLDVSRRRELLVVVCTVSIMPKSEFPFVVSHSFYLYNSGFHFDFLSFQTQSIPTTPI